MSIPKSIKFAKRIITDHDRKQPILFPTPGRDENQITLKQNYSWLKNEEDEIPFNYRMYLILEKIKTQRFWGQLRDALLPLHEATDK